MDSKKRTAKVLVGLLVVVLWLTLLLSVGYAQIPHKMNYQGYLTNAAGVPINGTLQMVFSIYNVSSGGTPLWTETHSVTVSQGVYSVILGEGTIPNPINLPFNTPYYLGVQVGADPEMLPRKVLTSVGYAFRALTVESIGGHTHSGADITNGTVSEPRIDPLIARDSEVTATVNTHASRTDNPHSTTASQVGAVSLNQPNSITSAMIVDGAIAYADVGFNYAGSPSKGGPAMDLSCVGCVSTSELTDSAVTKAKLQDPGGTAGQVLGTDGTKLAWQNPSTGVGWIDNGEWVQLATGTDKVGIGTNNIQAKLEVGDLMRVQGPGWPTWPASGQGMELAYSSDLNKGYIQVYNRSANKGVNPWGDLYLGDGNVGIGITPEVKLDVNGWIKARNGYGDAISIGGDSSGDDLEINIYPTVDWVNTISFWNGRMGVPANIGAATVSASALHLASDLRLKKNIKPIEGALDKIALLRGVTFEWRKEESCCKGFDEGKKMGLIAQEVEGVLPEVVSRNIQNGTKSVEYANLVAVLIEAVKELRDQNQKLQFRIEVLEDRKSSPEGREKP